MSLTDTHGGTLEYFLDEHIEKCSINIFLASYPSCEVVSAWYRLLPVSQSVSRVIKKLQSKDLSLKIKAGILYL